VTKLAERRPPFCACCFQPPQGRSVDFEAAYDGPVIPGTPEPIPVDDLVICENCLQEAFVILDPQGLKETIAQLEGIVKELLDENRAKDKAILGARATIGELVDHPVAKVTGPPALFGVEDDVRELILKRRRKVKERA
jgi:hypothetical protein